MNTRIRVWTHITLLCVAFSTGCSHKVDAGTELEKATKALADGQTSQQPTPPGPPASPVTESTPASAPAALTPATPTTPAQEMNRALVAYRSGDFEDAVTRLQKLRMTVALTPQQRMAVQDGVAALMTEIYGLAARGDGRAIEAVKQYETMQTTR